MSDRIVDKKPCFACKKSNCRSRVIAKRILKYANVQRIYRRSSRLVVVWRRLYAMLCGPEIAPCEAPRSRNPGRGAGRGTTECADAGFANVGGSDRRFHRLLREFRRDDGSIAGDRVPLIDFDSPAKNDWLALNQSRWFKDSTIDGPTLWCLAAGCHWR